MPSSRFSYTADQLREHRDKRARSREGARRDRGRNRGERRLRPDGHGAARRSRDHRVQPRQGHRRHGLRRPAARARQQLRFLAAGGARHGGRGAVDRALHRARRLRRARRSRSCSRATFPISTCGIRGTCPSSARSSSRKACEDAGFAVDKRISNSEGATVSTQESQFVYGNSLGFLGGLSRTRATASGARSSPGKDDEMQRDDWYETARDPLDLPAAGARRAPRRRARGEARRRAQDRDHARRRCCSKRRSRRACSDISCPR